MADLTDIIAAHLAKPTVNNRFVGAWEEGGSVFGGVILQIAGEIADAIKKAQTFEYIARNTNGGGSIVSKLYVAQADREVQRREHNDPPHVYDEWFRAPDHEAIYRRLVSEWEVVQ
jgi:hypothetical protein